MKQNKDLTHGKLYWLIFFMVAFALCIPFIQSAVAGGLKVSPINPRYFSDSKGNIVYLTGSHTWDSMKDFNPVIFDYPGYLDFLVAHNHNFFRLWYWEESEMLLDGSNLPLTPNVYTRTGPGIANDGLLKFDLTKFNQDYFDRLRSRVIAARDRGIYVSIMLFNGFSIEAKYLNDPGSGNPWDVHPFNQANNINNVNGDQNNNGNGEEIHTLQIPAITSLQEAYIRKVIETVNDLDNVLYEVSNESDGTSAVTKWEYFIIGYIKQYEASKPNQHPVGMTAEYPNGNNTDLFNSPADWISPNSYAQSPYDYQTNPPAADGSKVILSDTDHLWGLGGDRVWAWKSFLRGLNVIYMDAYLGNSINQFFIPDESLRLNMGYILGYADRMNLLAMTPQSDLSSTGYCLALVGSEYMMYSPSGGTFTVNLVSTYGTFSVEWFNPSTGETTMGGMVSGGVQESFVPPFSGDAVLYLKTTNYTLNIYVVNGHGMITASPSTGPYTQGTVVYLTATAESGYQVAAWTGTNNDSAKGISNSVTMNADQTVLVEFEPVSNAEENKSGGGGGGGCFISTAASDVSMTQESIFLSFADIVYINVARFGRLFISK